MTAANTSLLQDKLNTRALLRLSDDIKGALRALEALTQQVPLREDSLRLDTTDCSEGEAKIDGKQVTVRVWMITRALESMLTRALSEKYIRAETADFLKQVDAVGSIIDEGS